LTWKKNREATLRKEAERKPGDSYGKTGKFCHGDGGGGGKPETRLDVDEIEKPGSKKEKKRGKHRGSTCLE